MFPLDELDERLAMIAEATSNVSNVVCEGTEDVVVTYAKERGAVALIRGVRGATDAEYEIELAQTNRLLAPEMTTLFVAADPHLSEVSSSLLKHLAAQGMDVRRFAPPSVLRRLAVLAAPPSTRETVHGSP
jgi:pantetheine-phosphate adenylyltransferase